jgi:hypothetical protein
MAYILFPPIAHSAIGRKIYKPLLNNQRNFMKKSFKSIMALSVLFTSLVTSANEGTFEVLMAPANLVVLSSDVSSDGGCNQDPYCQAFVPLTLAVTSYGVATTVALVILLKKDDVRGLIERAEMENEVSSELKSVIDQMQAEFKNKSGVEISEEDALSQLQAQTI